MKWLYNAERQWQVEDRSGDFSSANSAEITTQGLPKVSPQEVSLGLETPGYQLFLILSYLWAMSF